MTASSDAQGLPHTASLWGEPLQLAALQVSPRYFSHFGKIIKSSENERVGDPNSCLLGIQSVSFTQHYAAPTVTTAGTPLSLFSPYSYKQMAFMQELGRR